MWAVNPLKTSVKSVADESLSYFIIFSRENKAWHLILIICWTDNSQEMSNLIVSVKYKKKNKPQNNKMLSDAVVINT